jgi:gamma-glutamyltranspeptidase/glutathione hydrolase
MKGAVTSGHPLTSRAAFEMFREGGNAFDAVVSAAFTSVVSEPTLTSLGGGGFLLTHIEEEKKDILFDFFVNTPGIDSIQKKKPPMKPVKIHFPSCNQIFHTGYGSAAVPGMLKGLMYVHKRLCTLPLETILRPALNYLDEGVVVNEKQEIFLGYLKTIFTSTDYGKLIYMKRNRVLKRSDRILNPLLKDFLSGLIQGTSDIYRGETAEKFIQEMTERHGLLTMADLSAYRVIEREPLYIQYRDRIIITNPPPSFGGIMLAISLKLAECVDFSACRRLSKEHIVQLIEVMRTADNFRAHKKGGWAKDISYPFSEHISVVDERGNAASMTTSNGSGSGCFIPGTGIMLNNMMGEDDLHPNGFFSSPCGLRVPSMMIPTIIMNKGKVEAALGSGGSKRIRTAILQVLINLIDFNCKLREAIEEPRVHLEDGVVQAEPGINAGFLDDLKKHYWINVWKEKNMYFGGVHTVCDPNKGWGDSRRDGNFLNYV